MSLRQFLGACTLLLAGLGVAYPAGAPSTAAPAQRVVSLRLDDEIEPIAAEYIQQRIAEANRDGASLILISLSTPGGLDTSMREIIQSILQSKIPVVTYVSPTGSRAASAGFFILLSGDVAAMAPGTDTGAASPLIVLGGAPVQIDETLRHKIVNEASAYIRTIASERGRNTDLAEKAVTEAKAFSEREALDGKLIDLVAASPEELLAALNGRTIRRFNGESQQLVLDHPVIEVLSMSPRQRFLARIVQPDVFFLLLIIGALGLYVEFTHPGLFAPGVVGAIALVLALFAMHLLPVNITGLMLILVALVLFALEAKFPTHGVLGVGGIVAMVLGALMLVRSPITGMGVSMGAALGITLPAAVIVFFLMRLVLRSRGWKRSTGREQLVGEVGEVTEPIDVAGPIVVAGLTKNRGMVLVHGELWQAVASVGIPRGAQVRVSRVEGLLLRVEPLAVKDGVPDAAGVPPPANRLAH
jgi:membrane-bound serine protease (ClpP class)